MMYTADEMRTKQRESAEDQTHDEHEVSEISEYIKNAMDKLIEFPAVHEIIIPKDILSKYSRGSILYIAKLLKETFKYEVVYANSRDMARTFETLTIKW